ncbi:hypothetical protein MYX82_02205 [Acidobacteria bacterium AH-259-D05]|nr:hypothetical protein [Acidobacteria bacterium AH-259-D05]
MKMPTPIRVECQAGYKSEERPLRFYLGDRQYQVDEVIEQWYEPEAIFFRVRADDGKIYVLRHGKEGPEEEWTVESVSG